MSKKKATMTLKDFHGGSIPSDLTLPSAPGLVVRPSDRPGYDRPAPPWGNQIGRTDNRAARPHTSPAARRLDDKAPFLTHASNIGRNFDEDERKPLDGGGAAPRRTVGDDTRSAAMAEPKRESVSASGGGGGGPWGRQGGSQQNAWGARKEVEPRSQAAPWSAPEAASKLAHASALDKVSSGRWQSKPLAAANFPAEVESGGGVAHSHSKGYGSHEDHERAANYRENRGGSGKSGGGAANLQSQTSPEPLERPKLKLLPRSKPLESLESPVNEPIQGYQHVTEVYTEQVDEGDGNLNPTMSEPVSVESEKQVAERPKLNLKPRSQPVDQLDGSVEGERNFLFGGARPRELVLKERGIDDVVINQDSVQHNAERVEHNTPRTERISGHGNSSRYNERNDNNNNPGLDPRAGKRSENLAAADQRIGKKPERRDHHHHQQQQPAAAATAWRGVESRRNVWEMEKPPHQQPSDRAPSPETWRKPAEQPKPVVDSAGQRYGKVASAVDLATSFSKSSVSDPTDRSYTSGQRRAQSQTPFSRLTGPTTPRPQPQINGY